MPVAGFRKEYPEETVARVRQLYESGYSLTKISKLFGIPYGTVWAIRKRNGIELRPQSSYIPIGEDNWSWKGDKIKYRSAHTRVCNQRGKPQHCEVCGTEDPAVRYQWANLTGKYSDPSDYKRMCQSCHAKHDKVGKHLHGLNPRNIAHRTLRCLKGHDMRIPNSFYVNKTSGYRTCRICRREHEREIRRRKRECAA